MVRRSEKGAVVHVLDRGLDLVLDCSLWPDPIGCERRAGLGCYASNAKLRLQDWAVIRQALLLHGYICIYGM